MTGEIVSGASPDPFWVERLGITPERLKLLLSRMGNLPIRCLARWTTISEVSIRQMIAGLRNIPDRQAAWLADLEHWAKDHPPASTSGSRHGDLITPKRLEQLLARMGSFPVSCMANWMQVPEPNLHGMLAGNASSLTVREAAWLARLETWVNEHPPPKKTGGMRITDEQASAIRGDTRSYRVIAEEYGIGASHVSLIKSRKRRA